MFSVFCALCYSGSDSEETSNQFACDLCNYKSAYKKNLQDHIQVSSDSALNTQ